MPKVQVVTLPPLRKLGATVIVPHGPGSLPIPSPHWILKTDEGKMVGHAVLLPLIQAAVCPCQPGESTDPLTDEMVAPMLPEPGTPAGPVAWVIMVAPVGTVPIPKVWLNPNRPIPGITEYMRLPPARSTVFPFPRISHASPRRGENSRKSPL